MKVPKPHFLLHLDDMKTPNEVVVGIVDKALNVIFNNSLGAYIQIIPNETQIKVCPLDAKSDVDIPIDEGWSKVDFELADDKRDRIPERLSFYLTETMADIWNKFHATEFILFYLPEEFRVIVYWNYGMDKKTIRAYWVSNEQNGYNLKAPFWTREWLKPEHKKRTDGGGKI